VIRWYYKCGDCLTPIAIDVAEGKAPVALECPCGGRASRMGRVVRERILDDRERCPCDERCTGASGPACDCTCGGENHGSGRVETYTVDQGRARLVARSPAVMLERANAYRIELAAVDAAIAADPQLAAAFADRRAGVRIGPAAWQRCERIASARSHARGMKVATTRLRKLRELAASIRSGAI
jgi:hypothetical protein